MTAVEALHHSGNPHGVPFSSVAPDSMDGGVFGKLKAPDHTGTHTDENRNNTQGVSAVYTKSTEHQNGHIGSESPTLITTSPSTTHAQQNGQTDATPLQANCDTTSVITTSNKPSVHSLQQSSQQVTSIPPGSSVPAPALPPVAEITPGSGGIRPKSRSMNEADMNSRPVVMRRPSKTSADGVDELSEGSSTQHREELQQMRQRSSSVLEYKEHANCRLEEELARATQELMLKDEECKKLTRIREQMGEEIEDLTASLFEEANKMVQDAHVSRMRAEKLLKEANTKIDVLQAEVTALKTLVITSTPSTPNTHLHPQIDQQGAKPSAQPKKSSSKEGFTKGHRRSTSHHNISREIKLTELRLPPLQPIRPAASTDNICSAAKPTKDEGIDPTVWTSFCEWVSAPVADPKCAFLQQIMAEDITPALNFPNTQLSESIVQSVMNHTLIIEPVHEKDPGQRKCSLLRVDRICRHRMKLNETEQFWFISQAARNRVTCVCNFFTYVKYIVQGLVKSSEKDIYWEMMRLRKEMTLAKLGLATSNT